MKNERLKISKKDLKFFLHFRSGPTLRHIALTKVSVCRDCLPE